MKNKSYQLSFWQVNKNNRKGEYLILAIAYDILAIAKK